MQNDDPVLVGRTLLRRQLARWRAVEPAVRRGVAPDALHSLRVTARRLVAALQWLAAVPVDGAAGLPSRVRGLLARTSPARDLDMRIAELTAGDEPEREHALQSVLQPLRRARARQQASLRRALQSPAAAQLFTALHSLDAQLAGAAATHGVAGVAQPLLRRRYRRLRKAARRVKRHPDPAHCHAMRLETKKLRYLVEALAGLQPRPMRRYLRRLRHLQALLGHINDAQQSIEWIRLQTRRHRRSLGRQGEEALAQIRERQARRLARSLEELPEAWRSASGSRWRRLRDSLQQ